jgi:predicted AlkP superfamily pyrophosphatase or phosphodiesterase
MTRLSSTVCCLLCSLFLVGIASWHAAAQSVPQRGLLLISIDGLIPGYVTEADRYQLQIPTLRRILREGSHARGVRGVLPTVTYPNHTTLLTGVLPAEHGVYQNVVLDPLGKNYGGWYWYSEDIRVPTLWEAATRAGYSVGSVSWPVSVGARGVKYLIPEFWRAMIPEDLKLLAAVSTPGLLRELEKDLGPYNTDLDAGVPNDWMRTRYAEAIIRSKHTRFITVHLAALDHVEHETGPFSSESFATLEEIDSMVAALGRAIEAEDPRSAISIVSDHGFSSTHHQLNLRQAFVAAGLLTADLLRPGAVTDWKAAPWPTGGGAFIVLKDPADSPTRAKVQELLRRLASDTANGVEQVLDRQGIAALGGTPDAEFFVDMRPGFAVGNALDGPLVRDIEIHGDHGFSPVHSEMRAAFFFAGQGIRQDLDLGEIDMRSIAPTMATFLGAALPSATLPPLEVFSPGDGGRK